MTDVANPLAPDDVVEAADEKGLSQQDFRKLMMTPRPGATPSFRSGRVERVAQPKPQVQEKKFSKPDKSKYKKYFKEKMLKEKEENEKYRDRATERRKGRNTDYEEIEKEAAAAAQNINIESQNRDERLTEIERSKYLGGDEKHTHLVKGLDFVLLEKRQKEIEELEKEKEEGKMKTTTEEAKPKKKLEIKSGMAKRIFSEITTSKDSRPLEWFLPGRTAFVFPLDFEKEEVLQSTRSKHDCPAVREVMQAEPIDHALMSNIENIMSYNRQGASAPKKRKKDKEEKALVKRIIDELEYVNLKNVEPIESAAQRLKEQELAARGLRRQREAAQRARQEAPKAPPPRPSESKSSKPPQAGQKRQAPQDDGDDMLFPDAGTDYVSKPNAKRRKRDLAPAVPPGVVIPREEGEVAQPYDASATAAYPGMYQQYPPANMYPGQYQQYPPPGMYGTHGAPPPYPPPTENQTKYDSAVASGAQRLSEAQENERGAGTFFRKGNVSERKRDAREKDPKFVGDDYAECYPESFQGGAGSLAYIDDDSDGEADFGKMDVGPKKHGLKRHDFATEDDWNEYKDRQEALPKAAFQFGQKMSDGRKPKSKKLNSYNEKDYEKKISDELNQINQIMKRSKGERGGGGSPGRGEKRRSEWESGSDRKRSRR